MVTKLDDAGMLQALEGLDLKPEPTKQRRGRMVEPLERSGAAIRCPAQIHRRHCAPTEEPLWNVVTDASREFSCAQVVSSPGGQEGQKIGLSGEGFTEVFGYCGEELCRQAFSGDGAGGGFFLWCNRA